MALFFARISRMVPVIVVLLVAMALVYAVIYITQGSARAKEVSLKVFWWICAVGSAISALTMLYAWFDGSDLMFDFAFCNLVVMLFAWAIDLLCAWRFKKNNPRYSFRLTTPRPKTKDK